MSEQKVEDRLTSADIKKQIEAKKEELKNSGMPLTGQMANEINASESTPKATTNTEVKPQPQPGAAKGVEVAAEESKDSKDYKEWAKKKGIDWTTDDGVLKALHMSDQQFHEKRAKEKAQGPTPPAYVPPAYNPPPYIPQNRAVLENLGRQYNMPPEDVERLLNFNRDFFQIASAQERDQVRKEMETMKRENQKNSVFRELSSDPVFRQPNIAMEFHRVVEEMQSHDPQSFEEDPNQYIRAYERAQVNVFRRNLEGKELQEGVPPVSKELRIPTTPPRPLGQGSGGGVDENESGFDRDAYFKLKTPEEKRKVFEKMGLVSGY